MKKIIIVFLVLIQLSFICTNAYSNEFNEEEAITDVFLSNSNSSDSKVPVVEAGSAIVIDSISGRVLYEKNAYSKMPMASTTKIMTAIIAIERGDLNESVTVSKRAAEIWGSTIGLKKGQKYKLKELLYGLMLNSGNDAAIVIAEHIGGTVEDFVSIMNEKALQIGAADTQFKSPHGLDMDGHYSTAFDMAIIARYALSNSVFSNIVSTKSTSIPGKNLYNTNEMLSIYPGADGVKTGYTGKAGRCLVTSVTKNDWRIISVVLNCPTRNKRAQSSKNMLDYAYKNYNIFRIISSDVLIKRINVVKGISNNAAVHAVDNVTLPLRQDEIDNFETQIDLTDSINAPVFEGVEVGRIRILVKGQIIAESALKTIENVPKKGVYDFMKEIMANWIKIIRWID